MVNVMKVTFGKLLLILSLGVGITSSALSSPRLNDMKDSEQGQTQNDTEQQSKQLTSLKNFQHNTPSMYSSGLPSPADFEALKARGLTHVVDLLPGDRGNEIHTTSTLELSYLNIPVEWDTPLLTDFLTYARFMETVNDEKGIVLTHCKLNWRGAVFTYLYRVAILGEEEMTAKKDLMQIWHPNSTWYAFMEQVLEHYNSLRGSELNMTFKPAD